MASETQGLNEMLYIKVIFLGCRTISGNDKWQGTKIRGGL